MKTGHVGLNVTDLDRSKDFYQRVFGFQVHAESADPLQRWAFLGPEGTTAVTLWQQSEGQFGPGHPGLHHLSFQVGSVEEVLAVEARLRELDATLHHDGVVPHAEGSQSGGVFFADPDGIRLEVYAPSAPTPHAAPTGAAPTCGFF
ncbi:hypothetical protein Lfu02_12530 [Longispora fulva]|uniref:Catechol 2,3-dioxygenase-like lactoylglutathione lyase family enzyme n=1 Tax=Longispora fulva TaxID=619741 RepID=A0A8J7GE72_9ACTN|nr:VOC family protein [Longispora fulva]MBG6134887.1 catechol 2,3-dioxygenase-like lactoylglutathione lyase family enzyme [Longispora fulva]GIG56881.1 hypothetical protein Lfu02_12530 [Longispora fulva]